MTDDDRKCNMTIFPNLTYSCNIKHVNDKSFYHLAHLALIALQPFYEKNLHAQ